MTLSPACVTIFLTDLLTGVSAGQQVQQKPRVAQATELPTRVRGGVVVRVIPRRAGLPPLFTPLHTFLHAEHGSSCDPRTWATPFVSTDAGYPRSS